LDDKNRQETELMLKTTEIDWDAVVKVSTAHFVFPEIYCNFKRANCFPKEINGIWDKNSKM